MLCRITRLSETTASDDIDRGAQGVRKIAVLLSRKVRKILLVPPRGKKQMAIVIGILI
jgi:hypothetical protein